jgi:hypothetical protein
MWSASQSVILDSKRNEHKGANEKKKRCNCHVKQFARASKRATGFFFKLLLERCSLLSLT